MKQFSAPAFCFALTSAILFSPPAAGDPPTDARPLSQIVQALEKVPGYLFLQELRWDESARAWVAIYRVTNGMDKHILIDAQSGAITETGPDGSVSEAQTPEPIDGIEEDDQTEIPTPNGME